MTQPLTPEQARDFADLFDNLRNEAGENVLNPITPSITATMRAYADALTRLSAYEEAVGGVDRRRGCASNGNG